MPVLHGRQSYGRGAFHIHKFRPDGVPIHGAQVPSGNATPSSALDQDASFNRHRLHASCPLRDHDRVDLDFASEAHSTTALRIDVEVQLHAKS